MKEEGLNQGGKPLIALKMIKPNLREAELLAGIASADQAADPVRARFSPGSAGGQCFGCR
ncbi:MAG: hypothetical protein A3J97_14030 [Spirochaetes bacterium RIFOXYC1_FULL_54_7]|nr:MAG: hypothetical protein A3J97_14030 [Spirochaetes bacterium RIFOXYC1_FULL_54_7]